MKKDSIDLFFKWQQYQKGQSLLWCLINAFKATISKVHDNATIAKQERFKFKKDFGMQTQNNHATRKP